MAAPYQVLTSPHFDRLARKLAKRHKDFPQYFDDALRILTKDPLGASTGRSTHTIKKLTNVPSGEGQYRLRLRRFRFRYDVIGQDVVLHYCGLRREDTYR